MNKRMDYSMNQWIIRLWSPPAALMSPSRYFAAFVCSIRLQALNENDADDDHRHHTYHHSLFIFHTFHPLSSSLLSHTMPSAIIATIVIVFTISSAITATHHRCYQSSLLPIIVAAIVARISFTTIFIFISIVILTFKVAIKSIKMIIR